MSLFIHSILECLAGIWTEIFLQVSQLSWKRLSLFHCFNAKTSPTRENMSQLGSSLTLKSLLMLKSFWEGKSVHLRFLSWAIKGLLFEYKLTPGEKLNVWILHSYLNHFNFDILRLPYESDWHVETSQSSTYNPEPGAETTTDTSKWRNATATEPTQSNWGKSWKVKMVSGDMTVSEGNRTVENAG